MKLNATIIVVTAFLLGMLTSLFLGSFSYPSKSSSTTSYVVANAESVREEKDTNFVTRILGMENIEQPSPHDWVQEGNIIVEDGKITINLKDAQWSRFTDTNSMDPVIDENANAIQIVPKDISQIHVGDIVSYKSDYADGTIIHRVMEIGYDDMGWYCLMKGDNNNGMDPGKIRFSQIKRVVVAIIY
jgi:hypothetical protein